MAPPITKKDMAVNQAVVDSVNKGIAQFERNRKNEKIHLGDGTAQLYMYIVNQIRQDKSVDETTIQRLTGERDLSDSMFGGENPEEYQYILSVLAKRKPETGYLSHIADVLESGQSHEQSYGYDPKFKMTVPRSFLEDLQEQRIKDFQKKENFGKTGKFFDAIGSLGAGDAIQGIPKGLKGLGKVVTDRKALPYIPKLVQSANAEKNIAGVVFTANMASLGKKAKSAVTALFSSPKSACLSAFNKMKTSIASAWHSTGWGLKSMMGFGLVSSALTSCSTEKETKSSGPVYPPLWMPQAVGLPVAFFNSTEASLKSASSRANKLANFYKKLWDNAQKTGKSVYVKGAGNMTPKQLQQRYQEYAKFSSLLKNAYVVPQSMYKQCGIDRLRNASMSKLDSIRNWAYSKASQDAKLIASLVSKNTLTYTNKATGKTESIMDLEVRIAQYRKLYEDATAEGQRRIINQQQKEQEQARQQQQTLVAQQQQYVAQNANNYQTAYMDQQSMQQQQAQMPMAQGQYLSQAQASQTDGGWGSTIFNYFKDQKFDFGSVGTMIANIPDYIFGAFTGKNNNMDLKSLFLPLAGLAVANRMSGPLRLGMTLVSLFGLFTAFNKEHQAEIAKTTGVSDIIQQQQAKSYIQYTNEELNPRLSSPHITGDTLLMDIDNKPCTIVIPTKTAEAYKQGALPLNTLANAILQKYDSDQKAASEAYEQQQTYSRGAERSRT